MLDILPLYAEDTRQYLSAYRKAFAGVADPVPGQIARHHSGFHAKRFDADRLFADGDYPCLDNPAVINTVFPGVVSVHVEDFALFQHGLLAAGDNAAGFGINPLYNEVDFRAQHPA